MRTFASRNRAAVLLALVAAAGPLAAADGPALPFGKSLAGGQELPLPFGIGLTVYGQHQEYQLAKLAFDLPGVTIDPGAIAIDNGIQEVNVQLDAWLFPFLNLFGIAGKIDGRTNVDFSRVAGLPVPLGRLRIDYDGEVYGLGATLAAGGANWFGSLTTIWTTENLSGDFDSDAEALVISPRVGLRDERGAVWIVATYQDAQETHKGTIALPFLGPVGFDVELEEHDPWSFGVGAAAALSEHWSLHLEGGLAQRRTAEFGATYRF